jgi:predicted esterase
MIKENHIAVQKTARYYTLGEFGQNTKSIWIVLHGFRQNAAGFLSDFEPLLNPTTFFIAPEGLNRFYLDGYTGKVGATWMTKEDRLNEIKDYISYLNELHRHFKLESFSGKITALGYSQGASTLTRWINAGNCKIDNAIVYAGEVAPDILPLAENSGLRRTENYFIYANRDEYFTLDLLAKARENYKPLNFTEVEFDGGHELNLEVLKPMIKS